MYTEHFGLTEKPFSISPDPRYLYLSQRHADALAHLLYGITESNGFIQLTGEVGTGKTTLIRSLLGQLPDSTEIALILNPQLSTKQFLQAICRELEVGFVTRDTASTLIDRLNARLLELHAEGRRAVLIVDEAQTMSPELLEQIRLLTNLETDRQKLLQIVLIGQPELRDMLARRSMRQIAQRITGRYHLEPLTAADTAVYVGHRMSVAGGRPGIFGRGAIRALYRRARGIPRLINVIADRALLAAYTRDETRIGGGLVDRAADEVFGRAHAARWWPWITTAAGVGLVLFGVSLLWRPDDAVSGAAADAFDDTPETSAAAVEPEETAGPAVGALPSLAELLGTGAADAAAGRAATAAATTALFAQWGLELVPDGAVPCEQAAAAGLRCLSLEAAPLGEIRRLARPARLELVGADGTAHYVTLTELAGHDATLVIGGKPHRIAIADLSQYAFGEQLLLFRPAISMREGPLTVGDRGLEVVWLRTALADLGNDVPATETPDIFDERLAAAVSAFQRGEGLDVDGVVGDRTLIALQTAIGLVGRNLETGAH